MKTNIKKIRVPECGYYLRTIYFYLTGGCNFKCRHCEINSQHERESKKKYPYIDFELFKSIVWQGKTLGMSSVKLTGGEPLLHPEIDKILDYININSLNLDIETNGRDLTDTIIEKFLKTKNHFLSISLDGVDAETHEWIRGVPNCFNETLDSIRKLVKAGYQPQIIMSIQKNNVDQMEAMVRLAEKENCESVKFNIVTPVAHGEQMHDLEQTLSIKELIDIGTWVENTLKPSTKLRVVYSHPEAFRPISEIYGKSSGRCGISSIIGVLGSGEYALCGIGKSVPELVFGHASKDKLAHVWNNNPILKDIRKGLPTKLKGICKDCVMKNSCQASCIAINYYRHRDLFAPHWYCEEAYKLGLFPTSRIIPGSDSEYSKSETQKIENMEIDYCRPKLHGVTIVKPLSGSYPSGRTAYRLLTTADRTLPLSLLMIDVTHNPNCYKISKRWGTCCRAAWRPNDRYAQRSPTRRPKFPILSPPIYRGCDYAGYVMHITDITRYCTNGNDTAICQVQLEE